MPSRRGVILLFLSLLLYVFGPAAAAANEEGRRLVQREYVQTKERKYKGANKKGTVLTKKELRLRMQRRRGRRRRRRKRGQSLADRAQQVQRKKEQQKKNREKAPKTTLPYPIQDREDSPFGGSSSEDKAFADRTTDRVRNSGHDELVGASQEDSTSRIERDAPRERHKHRPNVGSAQNSQHAIQDREGDASSSSEDKKFADRASSRTQYSGDDELVGASQDDSTSRIERDAPRERHKHRPDLDLSGHQQSDSKGGQSEAEISEDEDDGPQMVSGPPIAADTRLRWRCAYPGEMCRRLISPRV